MNHVLQHQSLKNAHIVDCQGSIWLYELKAKPSRRANKDWDVTEKVSREGRDIIQEMVDKGEINDWKARWMKPNDCRAPRLTGYPKVHKADVPLRGVVSFIGSPYENVAKTLVPILRKNARTKRTLH